jgi:uncharacterized cupin superfamily protein
MIRILVSIIVFGATTAFAQINENLTRLQPSKDFENIEVQKLYSDSNGTSFCIWVKKNVKAHKHVTHTEHIYILEGTGILMIGDNKYEISQSDYYIIPQKFLLLFNEHKYIFVLAKFMLNQFAY